MVTKPDKDGAPVGTGVAYVRFTSPNEAERARKERHRQQMGVRYIECLPFTASHYTSPAALPPQMGPPAALGSPFAAGMNMRYPGAPAVQRPFPSMAALGRALPAHEVLLRSELPAVLLLCHSCDEPLGIPRLLMCPSLSAHAAAAAVQPFLLGGRLHTSGRCLRVLCRAVFREVIWEGMCRTWVHQGGAGQDLAGLHSGRCRSQAWGPHRPLSKP